ncbi:hypothetical protein JHK82_013400 [Glycine max]|nr:hypothetical protein JHK86_013423 [Glycine max]KAG5155431.1 hypothetical protein JHK82_013400 [Glycine max]KAH1251211.1 NAC domain-containing protein 82 [Glycine max]
MAKAVGVRFHPTGVELVVYFLKRKVMAKKICDGFIAELDIYKYAPWGLPDKSCLRTGELEWYFFCPLEKKYGSGSKMKLATKIRYWKATGKDRVVQHNNRTVGMIKTLIFHTGKSPCGERTDWDSYVVCKVFQKEGLGPRKGAHCARPFNEEEWDDEEIGIPCAALTAPVPILPMTSDGSVPNDNLPASGCTGSASISCLSGSLPSPGTVNPTGPNDQAANDNDILPMLDIFNDDKWFEEVYNPGQENIVEGASPSDDFFEGLEDYLAGFSSGQNTEFNTNGMRLLQGLKDYWAALAGFSAGQNTGDIGNSDNLDFIELNDLDTPLFYPITQP